MKVGLGDRVKTSDGADAGYVKYLIVAPEANKVDAVVLEKGFLFTHDVEARLDAFMEDSADGTRLRYRADEMRAMPEFDPSRYREVDELTATRFGFPNAALLWPTAYPYAGGGMGLGGGPVFVPTGDITQPVPVESVQRSEDDTIPPPGPHDFLVTNGTDVIAADGDRVGSVEKVVFDTVSGRPISLMVKKGVIFTDDVEIPADRIASVDSDAVYLRITRSEFETWSEAPTVPYV